jgi:RNA recognition motif-containing protein
VVLDSGGVTRVINVYVGNLPYATTEAELAELFAPYGEVGSTTIIVDRETGRSRGYGFVQVIDDQQGQKAIEDLHGTVFNGRPLTVNEARNSRSKGDGQGVADGGGHAAGYSRGRSRKPSPRHDGHGREDAPLSRGYSNAQRSAPQGD